MQSKRHSLLEAIANTTTGFVIAVALNWALLPLYGLQLSVSQSVSYTTIFMVVTTLRTYIWRRVFNKVDPNVL